VTAAVALPARPAAAGAGPAAYAGQLQRQDQAIEGPLNQEIGEFKAMQTEGDDPRTGKPFTSADRMLEVFLDNNLPDEHEVLLAFPSTSQVCYQGHADPEHLRSTELSKTVAALRAEGGSRTI